MSGFIAAAAQFVTSAVMIVKIVGLGLLLKAILDWVNTIRKISFFLDKLILKVVSRLYDYFELLIRGEMFNQETIDAFVGRIMLFVGIWIFFKLAIKMVNYAVNPDSVWDEQAGVGKIVQRAMFGLVTLVMIPTIFGLARNLQASLIDDHVIEYIFTGQKTQAGSNAMYSNGSAIGFTVWEGFASLNEGLASSVQKKSFQNAQKYKDADMMQNELITEKSGEDYVIDYFPFLSTIALAYIAFSLLTMCLNVVMRLLEMSVLQIISPIIIVNYIADSNDQTFGKWMKSAISSYVSIFIEIAIMSFIIFILQYLNNPDENTLLYVAPGKDPDYLLKALIIMGLFLFCKKIPDLISKIFGIELDKTASNFLKSLPRQTMGMLNKAKHLAGAPKRFADGAKKLGQNMYNKGLNATKNGARTLGGMRAGMQNSRDKGFFAKAAGAAHGGLRAASTDRASRWQQGANKAADTIGSAYVAGAISSTKEGLQSEQKMTQEQKDARYQQIKRDKAKKEALEKVKTEANKKYEHEIKENEQHIVNAQREAEIEKRMQDPKYKNMTREEAKAAATRDVMETELAKSKELLINQRVQEKGTITQNEISSAASQIETVAKQKATEMEQKMGANFDDQAEHRATEIMSKNQNISKEAAIGQAKTEMRTEMLNQAREEATTQIVMENRRQAVTKEVNSMTSDQILSQVNSSQVISEMASDFAISQAKSSGVTDSAKLTEISKNAQVNSRRMAVEQVVGTLEEKMDEVSSILYSNPEYVDQVRITTDAKNRRNMAQSTYEIAARQQQSSGSVTTIDGTQLDGQDAINYVDKLRVDYVKASSDYDFMNKELDTLGSKYPSDAQTRIDYEIAKDYEDKSRKISVYASKSSQVSNNEKEGGQITIEEQMVDDTVVSRLRRADAELAATKDTLITKKIELEQQGKILEAKIADSEVAQNDAETVRLKNELNINKVEIGRTSTSIAAAEIAERNIEMMDKASIMNDNNNALKALEAEYEKLENERVQLTSIDGGITSQRYNDITMKMNELESKMNVSIETPKFESTVLTGVDGFDRIGTPIRTEFENIVNQMEYDVKRYKDTSLSNEERLKAKNAAESALKQYTEERTKLVNGVHSGMSQEEAQKFEVELNSRISQIVYDLNTDSKVE